MAIAAKGVLTAKKVDSFGYMNSPVKKAQTLLNILFHISQVFNWFIWQNGCLKALFPARIKQWATGAQGLLTAMLLAVGYNKGMVIIIDILA